MLKVDIDFNVKDIFDIPNVLKKIQEQIEKGEFHYKNNQSGFLINKCNPIDILNPKELWDSEGYKIGNFRIRTEKYIQSHKE